MRFDEHVWCVCVCVCVCAMILPPSAAVRVRGGGGGSCVLYHIWLSTGRIVLHLCNLLLDTKEPLRRLVIAPSPVSPVSPASPVMECGKVSWG